MKKILEEPKPKFNTNSILNTKPETKEKFIQETIDNQSLFNTLDIYMIRATPLA